MTPAAGAPPEAYLDLVRLAPLGCLLLADGVVRAVNADALAVTGIPEPRLVGVELAELLLPELQDPWRELVAEASAAVRVQRTRLAGNLTPVELSTRRLAPGWVVVGVRSTSAEHHYSALAGAELTHDPVSGLANRHHVLSLLHHRVAAADRTPLAIIGLWIDELPKLAAQKGERAADRVVREVGQRLAHRLRGPDVLGRFDEAGFLGLLGSDAPADQLKAIGARLRAEVAFPVELDHSLVSFTASVAVATLRERRTSIEKALSQLEAAAGRAALGVNRTEILEI